MNRRLVDDMCRAAGAVAWGVSDAGPTDSADSAIYDSWLERGMHGPMAYMERHSELRRDPRLLLPGAQSIVVCAFAIRQSVHNPYVADFALGDDYHDVLRTRMEGVARGIREALGGDTRVCVDSAPLRERYWAVRAGLGNTGRNGRLIVRGIGSDVLLAEVLTTAALDSTPPAEEFEGCTGCDACMRACPAGALDGSGAVDARRCLACLTIEHRGELPEGTRLHGRLAGCDICARVCPANARPIPEPVEELRPREASLALTPDTALAMTQEEFSAAFRGSPLKRLRLAGLQRNAALFPDGPAK